VNPMTTIQNKTVDQPGLWIEDPKTEDFSEESAISIEHTGLGVSGSNPGRWQRVPYRTNYQPTPGLITGRDCYNAWCYVQQARAEMLRKQNCTIEANAIEREIWRGSGSNEQFEQMAAFLQRMVHPCEGDPSLPDRYHLRYGNDTDQGFTWRVVQEEE